MGECDNKGDKVGSKTTHFLICCCVQPQLVMTMTQVLVSDASVRLVRDYSLAIHIPLQYENYLVVFEKNLQSSDFYEFLPQAILCILVRVYNLLSLAFSKNIFLLSRWKK